MPVDPAVSPQCVVALGASAGGLEAFEEFFTNLPPSPGCAFVLIMHLDPNHKSMLPELLGKTTDMTVVQAKEGMQLEANQIHVIPPNASMRVKNGKLHLGKPEEKRGARRPIDDFFRSLAEDTGDHTVGIIFSGTGSDGALGLKEIKFAGGLAMIQEPSSAKFDSMPMAARHAGAADVALPPGELAARLADFLNKHGAVLPDPDNNEPSSDADALEQVLAEIRKQTGRDLTSYKRTTLRRRVEKRMLLRERDNLEGYRKLLQSDDDEVQTLLKELLIGVTSFFRDMEAFQALEDNVLPELFKNKESRDPIRIWVPGCSTGEEVYSLAMLIHSFLEKRKDRRTLQIFGTDVDEDAIQKARTGRYHASSVEDIPLQYRQKYIRRENGQFSISTSIRESVVFAPHDIVENPPFFRLDLVSCRNLLIYLTNDAQKKVMPLFAYSLTAGGFLFLGPSETLGSYGNYFEAIDNKWKIYKRKDVPASRIDVPLTSSAPWRGRFASPEQPASRPDSRTILRDAIVAKFGPPCVLVSDTDEILQVHGDVSPFLGLPEGEPTRDVYAAARKAVRMQLRSAMHKVRSEGEKITYTGIRIDGRDSTCTMSVAPVKVQKNNKFLLIAFSEEGQKTDKSLPPMPVDEVRDQLVKQLEEELEETSDKLQTTVEDLESANEELKSSNEELMSMNEELQSSNEELETSQEELQALNEELTTVNAELHAKISELDEARSDLENILRSSEIATIFIDRDYVIRQFTPAAKQIFHLEPSDVGRPLSHFASTVEGAPIMELTKQVLQTLSGLEEEVSSRNGRKFLLRILPYRTQEESIEGVVITFIDITERKAIEEQLRISNERLALALDATAVGVFDYNIPLDENTYHSEQWAKLLDFKKEELPEYDQFSEWLMDRIHPDDRKSMNDAYKSFISGEKDKYDMELRIQRKGGQYIWVRYVSKAVTRDEKGNATRIVGLMIDVTRHKKIEAELEDRVQERTRELDAVLSSVQDFLYTFDREGRFVFANKQLLHLWGKTPEQALGKTMEELDYPKDVAETLRNGLEQVFETGQKDSNITHYTSPTGARGSYENILAPMFDENGKVAYVAGSSREITDRLRAEEQQREREIQFRTLIENAPDIIARIDSNFRYSYVNPVIEQRTGYPQKHFLGKTIYEVGVRADGVGSIENCLRQAFGKGKECTAIIEMETKAGQRYYHTRFAPEYDNGDVRSVLAITNDVTEQVMLQQELMHAKEIAQEANEAKSAFLANMSHELRTPLTGILGMTGLILKDDDIDQIKEHAQLALQAGKQLQVILNDILDLAQIEANRVDLRPEPTNPREIVDEVCALQRTEAEVKDIRIACGCNNEVPDVILVDGKRLHQILANLVNNAIKYTNEGQIEVIVSALLEDKPQIRFQVVDTGVGMGPEQTSMIFEKFYQAENYLTKVNKGVGLGLTITQKLVELLGGEIMVESEPGKGSTFTVTIPYESVDQKKSHEKSSQPALNALQPLRVLLVEDNIINLKYISMLLEKAGHSVGQAKNGESCLEQLQNEHFDIVLMDVQMPVMDGMEATRHIRESDNKNIRELKIIGLTAYAMEEEIRTFLNAGMDLCVSKPVDDRKLAQAIQDTLGDSASKTSERIQ